MMYEKLVPKPIDRIYAAIRTSMGTLINLVYLDLSKNNLNSSVLALSSVQGCPKLETL